MKLGTASIVMESSDAGMLSMKFQSLKGRIVFMSVIVFSVSLTLPRT